MGQPAAKQGDRIEAQDKHLVQMPSPAAPKLDEFSFKGTLTEGLSEDVTIMGKPAATVGSGSRKTAPNPILPPGITFAVIQCCNEGTIQMGSSTVRINGKAAARDGDLALTCSEVPPIPAGRVVATGTVRIG